MVSCAPNTCFPNSRRTTQLEPEDATYHSMKLPPSIKPVYDSDGVYCGAPEPSNEESRSHLVNASNLMDGNRKPELDRITRLLWVRVGATISQISLTAGDTTYIASQHGDLEDLSCISVGKARSSNSCLNSLLLQNFSSFTPSLVAGVLLLWTFCSFECNDVLVVDNLTKGLLVFTFFFLFKLCLHIDIGIIYLFFRRPSLQGQPSSERIPSLQVVLRLANTPARLSVGNTLCTRLYNDHWVQTASLGSGQQQRLSLCVLILAILSLIVAINGGKVGDLSSQIPRALLMQVGAISNDGDEEWDIDEDGKSEAQSEPADENSNEGEDEEP